MQLDKKKLFLYGACACFLLALIMALTDVFKVSLLGASEGVSYGDLEKGWVTALLIIVNLAGIALLLLPEFGILPKMPLLKLCAIAAAALGLLIFIISWIVAGSSDEVKLVKEWGGSFGIGFTGILVILFELGAGALTYLGKEK